MFRYILFDLDGTALDTHEAIFQTFEHTLKKRLNVNVSRTELMKIFGEPLRKQMAYFSPELADSLCDTYRNFYAQCSAKLTVPFPGVREILDQLKELKIPVGIVTNKARIPAQRALEDLKLMSKIDFLIGYDQVTYPKPHPEALLTGMKLMHADPAKTLIIGDSPLDIEAGYRAGIKTALVSWSIFASDRFTLPPHYILDQMIDLIELVDGNVA